MIFGKYGIQKRKTGYTPLKINMETIMEVWKIMFLSEWVICRFHVNLPGCNGITRIHLQKQGKHRSFSLSLLKSEVNAEGKWKWSMTICRRCSSFMMKKVGCSLRNAQCINGCFYDLYTSSFLPVLCLELFTHLSATTTTGTTSILFGAIIRTTQMPLSYCWW